jgi:L-iditol 2-dehydrogenase
VRGITPRYVTSRCGSSTDIYLDAAGAKPVVDVALAAAKKDATLGTVGVHNEPVPVELVNVMSNEIT